MKRWLGSGLAIALLLASSLSVIASPGAAAQETSTFPVRIKFLNAMTAMESIDVFINGDDKDQRVIEGLAYGAVSDWVDGTSPATGIIIKRNVNMGFDQWLFNTVINTEAGNDYLVVVSDFILVPAKFQTLTEGELGANGRFVHGASQAPPVDVLVDDVVTVSDLGYGRASDGGSLGAGTYNLKVNQTGTSNLAIEVPEVAIEAGKAYIFVLIGKPGSTEQPLAVVQVDNGAAAA